jgi:hypothetical protein
MELPKRLDQDQASMVAIAHLCDEYHVDEVVSAYVEAVERHAAKHRHPAWPSAWSALTKATLMRHFEEWCYLSAMAPRR